MRTSCVPFNFLVSLKRSDFSDVTLNYVTDDIVAWQSNVTVLTKIDIKNA